MLQFIEAVGVKKEIISNCLEFVIFYSHISAEAPRMAASDSFK